jgi:hypothetical protein
VVLSGTDTKVPTPEPARITPFAQYEDARAAGVRARAVLVPACPSALVVSLVAPMAVVEAFAILTSGVVPADTEIGALPVTAVTGAVPLEAAVRRPLASTVKDEYV